MTRIEFTTACQGAPGVLILDFSQPPLLPNKHRHRVGESRLFSCSLVISGSYAYDPTKTEVLGMDERITTESAGT
ncbi:hypothetical protein IGI04_002298, partial [Brassica rapa subsp. trilocularis]